MTLSRPHTRTAPVTTAPIFPSPQRGTNLREASVCREAAAGLAPQIWLCFKLSPLLQAFLCVQSVPGSHWIPSDVHMN